VLVAKYATKKLLKESVGKALRYEETGMYFIQEYKATGIVSVVGPGAYNRKWYAVVIMKDDKIVRVT